jgi:hypothetical protein
VPEVLESSLQPTSGRWEPMNSIRRRMRPRAKHAVLMLSSLRRGGAKGVARGKFRSNNRLMSDDEYLMTIPEESREWKW